MTRAPQLHAPPAARRRRADLAVEPAALPVDLEVAPRSRRATRAWPSRRELTPMTANRTGRDRGRGGAAAGVLNIVHGLGAQAGRARRSIPLCARSRSPAARATGAAIAAAAAPFKKLTLELGGKNPTSSSPIADLDARSRRRRGSSFRNQGEICLCGSRIFVERAVLRPLRRRVHRAAAASHRRPARRGDRFGALVVPGHLREGRRATWTSRASEGGTDPRGGRRPGPRRHLAGGLPRAHRHHRARTRLPGDAGGDLRPRGHRHALRHDEEEAIATRQRHRASASRPRSGRATSPRPPRRRRSEPARSGSTAGSSATCASPSAA